MRATILDQMTQTVKDSINPLELAVEDTHRKLCQIAEARQTCRQVIKDHFQSVRDLLHRHGGHIEEELDKLYTAQSKFLEQRCKHLAADMRTTLLTADIAKYCLDTRKKSAIIQAAAMVANTQEKIQQKLRPEQKQWCPQPARIAPYLKEFQTAVLKSITLTGSKPEPTLLDLPKLFLVRIPGRFLVKSAADFNPPVVRVLNYTEEPSYSALVKVTKLANHTDTYHVSVTTRLPGQHTVVVSTSSFGVQLAHHSFTIQSWAIPATAKRVIGHIGNGPEDFDFPQGINRCGETFLIADFNNHRVKEFDIYGQLVGFFRMHGLQPTAAVRHSSKRVFSTGNAFDQIMAFDCSGKPRGWLGGHGCQPGKLQGPQGIGVTTDGLMVVSESINNRIQMFDTSGASVGTIGHHKLDQPVFLAVDPNNDNILVANCGNHTVEEFTRQGDHVRTIGNGWGHKLGQMKKPTGLALHPSGHILVVDSGNERICIYSREGECLGLWAKMQQPVDVACSAAGHVLVTTHSPHGFTIFSLKSRR